MDEPVFEIYAGQNCNKCGQELGEMSIGSFEESSIGGFLIIGACGHCGTENRDVVAKKVSK